MIKNKRGQEGFVSLLGLLLVLVIIGIIFYKAYGIYFGKPAVDKETKKILSNEGIDTTS